MTTRDQNLSDLVRKAKALQAEIDKLTAQQGQPEEPELCGVTELATFSKWFNGVQRYEFAAIRPAFQQVWSVTGAGNLTSVSWARLLDFIGKDESRPKRAYESFVLYEIDTDA